MAEVFEELQNWSKFELDAVDGQKAIGDALKWISSGGSARRLVEVFKNFVDLCIELIAPTDVQRDQQHYPLIYFIGVLSINRKGDYKLVNNVTTSMAGLIWVARALFLHYYLPADGDYVGILQANSESNSDQETGIASSLQASASTSSPVSVSAIFDNDNTVPGEVRPDLDPEDEVDEAIYGELADLGQDTSSDQKRSDAYLVAERRFLAKQQEFLTSYLGLPFPELITLFKYGITEAKKEKAAHSLIWLDNYETLHLSRGMDMIRKLAFLEA